MSEASGQDGSDEDSAGAVVTRIIEQNKALAEVLQGLLLCKNCQVCNHHVGSMVKLQAHIPRNKHVD